MPPGDSRREPAKCRARSGNAWPSPFNGGSEMARRMQSFDWGATELGPVDSWSMALRSAVSLCLGSRLCMAIYWGRNHLLLYNDAYRAILDVKHPAALAQSARTVWPEVAATIEPWIRKTLEQGVTTGFDDAPLFLNRSGFVEELYFSFSYTPVVNEHGAIEGVFATLPETTAKVVGERRLRTLQRLGSHTRFARRPAQALVSAADVIADNPYDLPFASCYLWEPGADEARLCAVAGMARGLPLSPETIALEAAMPLSRLLADAEQRPLQFFDMPPAVEPLPRSGWLEPARQCAALFLGTTAASSPRAVMLAGLNPHTRLDADYVEFLRMLSNEISRALTEATAHAREDERVRMLRAQAQVAQQEERLRIARDIHDTLLQSVQGMRILLEAGIAKYQAKGPIAGELFEQALRASVHAIDEGRNVLALLRSPAVPNEAPGASLSHLLDEILAGGRLRGSVHIRGRERAIRADVWPEIHAICREAVMNAVRHADASAIGIRLAFGRRLILQVTDDGRGVLNTERAPPQRGHYGLRGMQERAVLIKAELRIAPGVGGGTVIRLGVPGAIAYVDNPTPMLEEPE